MMKTSTKISILFLFLLISLPVSGQAANSIKEPQEKANIKHRLNWTKTSDNREFDIQNRDSQKIFEQIQDAISTRDITTISKHLRSQTYLNLPNGISGYYSANQAYFVLEDFLKKYRVMSFKFEEINTNTINPYATGIYNYEINGRRKSVHLYIQLRESSNNWSITQITTN